MMKKLKLVNKGRNIFSVSCMAIFILGLYVADVYYYTNKDTMKEHRINRKTYLMLSNHIAEINGFGWRKAKGIFKVETVY